MHFVRRDLEPGEFSLINLEQISTVRVRNEERPDEIQADVQLSDGRKETFKGLQARKLLGYLESQKGEPYLL